MNNINELNEILTYWMKAMTEEIRNQTYIHQRDQKVQFDTLMKRNDSLSQELLTLQEKIERLEDELLIALEGNDEAI